MDIKKITLNDLECGFIKEQENFNCIYCDYFTSADEVYQFNNRFFTAEAMIKMHLKTVHGGNFNALIDLPKKLTSLSESQKKYMKMIHEGYNDSQIAKELGIKEATVRYQRFSLKEKENQCKVFLAIMSNIKEYNCNDFLTIHSSAKQIDERYIATEKDKKKVETDFFESLNPLKLKSFPRKEKYKIIVLKIICDQFKEKEYSEKELNKVLKTIFDDFVTIRRYLIEYGFFTRDIACKKYMKLV